MARVIAIGPGGKAQAPARDDRYRPVLEWVAANAMLGRWLLSPAVQSEDKAHQVQLGLYRSGRYYCSCGTRYCTRKHDNITGCPDGGQRLSVQAKTVRDEEGMLRVQFRVMDKRDAMRAVVQKYGPDPNKWPYFAKRKRKASE
ncbi:MAG TPA: hypothetical protein VKU39_11305 [Streptosporangiaceae bacterium]|nr:hypothetical protein [Streptosporangiaceae bacterium]